MNIFKDPDVVPLQFLGSTETDLSTASASELLTHALANLSDEGGYAVRHGWKPVSDFGKPRQGEQHEAGTEHNFWALAFPCLFPYGEGGLEAERRVRVPFAEHVRYCLEHHSRCFRTHNSFPFVAFGILQRRQALTSARLQIGRKDFESHMAGINNLTSKDLEQAAMEDEQKKPISNPAVTRLLKHVRTTAGRIMGTDQSRSSIRSKVWSTTLM